VAEEDAQIDESEAKTEQEETKKKVVEIVEEKNFVAEARKHGLSDLEIVLALLIVLIAGVILGYYAIPKIKELLRRDNEREDEAFWFPDAPYDAISHDMLQPNTGPLLPSPEVHRRHLIDPAAIARTPDSLLRHGITLDEKGEACLDEPTVYETWTIIRDPHTGKVVDGFKSNDDEYEIE
jgi:hypothetical protein